MTGADAIDAVAASLGMKAALTTTVPSRIQILLWVNLAAREVAVHFAENMYELYDIDAAGSCGLKVFGASESDEGAKLVPYAEHVSRVGGTAETDGPSWIVGVDGVATAIVGVATTQYMREPTAYTDAAVVPDPGINTGWDMEVIRRAASMGWAAEHGADVANVLLRQVGPAGGK